MTFMNILQGKYHEGNILNGKIQPQISQSMSNLQIDCIQTAKNIIHNAVSAQKHCF